MKKIFFILFAALIFTASGFAQRASVLPLVAGDTVVNTGNTTKIINATGGYGAMTIQANATKISGTVAGNIVLFGSLDGVNYVATDSVPATNVAVSTAIFAKPSTNYSFYKVVHTGVGTMQSILTVYYLFRLFQPR